MRSATETGSRQGKAPLRALADTFEVWNRRVHYYAGLYLLFFVWLFAFSGLLLNHGNWKFAEFWPNRQQSAFDRAIAAPPPGGDLAQAQDILRQLGLEGEIEWTTSRPDPAKFDFRASRPGHIFEIHADLAKGHAQVQRIDLNTWGIVHILHTFTGVRAGDARNSRDWFLTSVWAFAMDAVAAGLLVMILTSLTMWYRLVPKRAPGMWALALGVLSCGLFAAGLRLLY